MNPGHDPGHDPDDGTGDGTAARAAGGPDAGAHPERVRELLAGVPMLAPPLPEFAPELAPEEPFPLFRAWLAEAVAAGVREPNAMTLATVDPADPLPDARVVALREAGAAGFQFATTASGPKARQLAANPRAALLFHWREQGRQIRVRGAAELADPAACAADFTVRPPGSRAADLVGRQSEPLAARTELTAALASARARAEAEPEYVDPAHQLWTVVPLSVEFWQGSPDRAHIRLRYERPSPAAPWRRGLLWP